MVNIGPSIGSEGFALFGGVGALPAKAAADGRGISGTSAGSGGLGGTWAASIMAWAAASAAFRASSAALAAALAAAASARAASRDSRKAACVCDKNVTHLTIRVKIIHLPLLALLCLLQLSSNYSLDSTVQR